MLRNACGSTISVMVWKVPKPCEYAASNWPLATELRPPRMISAMIAEVNSVNATIALNSVLTATVEVKPSSAAKPLLTFGAGHMTKQTNIHSISGVLRKSSMYAEASFCRILAGPLVQ